MPTRRMARRAKNDEEKAQDHRRNDRSGYADQRVRRALTTPVEDVNGVYPFSDEQKRRGLKQSGYKESYTSCQDP